MSAKLIILNGPCGIGKSTLAQQYIEENPLSLHVKIDEIIVMLGQWQKNEDIARKYAIDIAIQMIETHLRTGHDVIVPYILTSPSVAEQFEESARKLQVPFYEIALMAEKNEAIERMMKRGSWGEAGTDPLTENDREIVEQLYDAWSQTLKNRPNTIKIVSENGNITNTYRQLVEALS